MEPLPRSWLAFARSCMAMVPLPRSWQDLGKASKELAMDLGKGTMASNTGFAPTFRALRVCEHSWLHYNNKLYNINCTNFRVSFLYEMSGFAFVRNVWFWFLYEMSCVRFVVPPLQHVLQLKSCTTLSTARPANFDIVTFFHRQEFYTINCVDMGTFWEITLT